VGKTVYRLMVQPGLWFSLLCTNAIEEMQSTIRPATHKTKRLRDARLAEPSPA